MASPRPKSGQVPPPPGAGLTIVFGSDAFGGTVLDSRYCLPSCSVFGWVGHVVLVVLALGKAIVCVIEGGISGCLILVAVVGLVPIGHGG